MTIDGRSIAQTILEKLKAEVSRLAFKPIFCDVLVGNDPVSLSYVRIKGRSAEKIGMGFKMAKFDENISQVDLINEIKNLNQTPNLCGLIIQLPLPVRFKKQEVLDAINPRIDVDSTSQTNTALFYEGNANLEFPTAKAVMTILDSLNQDLKNKQFLVLGQGELVGKPVSFLLKQRGVRVQVADKNTQNTPELMAEADVIISAVGKAKLILGHNIKPGAIVIDAGTSELSGGIVGDTDFESVSKVASFLSPVPGGVGPVTVAMLLSNVLQVAKSLNR